MIDLESIVELHYRALRNFALHLSKSDDESDDLLQDTWLKCLPNLALLDTMSEQKQRSWLFTVLKNRWLDICRKRKLERMVCAQPLPATQTALSAYKVEAGMERLPALEQNILRMKYWEGSNSRQIAAELGIPEGTVRWRHKLAMDKLKDYISRSNKEEQWLL